MSLIVHLTLYAAPTDPYSRSTPKREGTIHEAVAVIEQHMTINSFEVTHDQHNQSKDQLAIIKGYTDCSLAMFTAAMYSNPMIASRMKTLATDYDVAEISTRRQAYVPTEAEIRAEKHRGSDEEFTEIYGCSKGLDCTDNMCPSHGRG